MVISIDRNTFKQTEKSNRTDVVLSMVKFSIHEYNEVYRCPSTDEKVILTESELEEVTRGIIHVIKKNEKVIKKYGFKKYLKDDFPAKHYVSGYYYRTGNIVLCPFDWTPNSEDDEENFDYSFTLARTI